METEQKYLIYQILIVLVIGLLIYSIFSPYFEQFLHHKSKVLTYLEKSLEFYEKDGKFLHLDVFYSPTGNLTSFLEVNKIGEDFSISLKRDLMIFTAIKKGENSYVCAEFNDEKACAEFQQAYSQLYSALKGNLLDRTWVENLFYKPLKALEEKGALKIVETKETTTPEGFNCKEFSLSYSYEDFTPTELSQIGMNPNHPLVLASKVEQKLCIGENGEIVYNNITTPSNLNWYFRLLNHSQPSEIEVGDVNSTKFEEIVNKYSRVMQELKKCEDDKCIRSVSVNERVPYLCSFAENKQACLDAYLAFTKDTRACSLFEEFSLEKPEVCNKPIITPPDTKEPAEKGNNLTHTQEG